MNEEMQERFQALADFMEWVDPEGYADVLAPDADVAVFVIAFLTTALVVRVVTT